MSMTLMSKQMTASGIVSPGPTRYGGFEVVATTAVGVINVRRGTVSGEILAVLAIGLTAAGSRALPNPISVPEGLYAEFNGGATGTVNILHG